MPEEDIETLMVDPITGDVYLLSKNEEEDEAIIYRQENGGNFLDY